jgi:hypothetical protein
MPRCRDIDNNDAKDCKIFIICVYPKYVPVGLLLRLNGAMMPITEKRNRY